MTEYKCSKCRMNLDETKYGMNRKNEMSNTCLKCEEYKKNYYKTKRNIKFEMSNDWKEHPTYKGYYANGKLGLVVNGKTKKIIGALIPIGYIHLFIIDGNNKIAIYAHRFVYECYNGIINDKILVINHINENKCDNRLYNLELVSKSENGKKATKKITGTRKPRKCQGKKENDIEWIQFKSLSDAGRKTLCVVNSIQLVCDGITNYVKSKTDGSKWIFKY